MRTISISIIDDLPRAKGDLPTRLLIRTPAPPRFGISSKEGEAGTFTVEVMPCGANFAQGVIVPSHCQEDEAAHKAEFFLTRYRAAGKGGEFEVYWSGRDLFVYMNDSCICHAYDCPDHVDIDLRKKGDTK